MQKIIEYLKGKEEISLPDLQLDLGVSYREVIAAHRKLSENGYLSERIEGIRVRVNSLYVTPGELGEDDIRACVEAFDWCELSLLRDIEEFFDKDNCAQCEFENLSKNDGIELLIRHKIVHEFEGKHYPSITPSSYERLKDALRAVLDNDFDLGAAIGYPLFMCWTVDPKKACDIMSLPFIPEECRDYVDAKVHVYEQTRRMPKSPNYKIKNKNIIKFEIIESFIDRCYFKTKDEYDSEAKKTLELIKRSDIFPDIIIMIMEQATKEIIEELTLTNIMEIRKIIGKFDG